MSWPASLPRWRHSEQLWFGAWPVYFFFFVQKLIPESVLEFEPLVMVLEFEKSIAVGFKDSQPEGMEQKFL